MANNIIPNVNPGELVGSKPTFPTNAVVRGDFLYLRDGSGNTISGRSVSDGDEITVLDISYSRQLALVQYPTGSGYRQGYVTNATSLIKYKDNYSWVNGSTPEAVYDLDKTSQIGSLDPRERAVVLYKVDGMTAVAYNTSKGKLTKSGLVHYAGSGSAGGSTGTGGFNGIAPGEIVPGGFSYDNNAEVVGDELYIRDANGNRIPGRSVSVGDRITVLDVGYTKQLTLVQYPAGNVIRQGYVTNATNLIRYFNQYQWHNGKSAEEVFDENGHHLGSLNPHEAATPLYKKNGMTHVVYNTDKGPNTKSGFVRFVGLEPKKVAIPQPSITNAQRIVYGKSGRGRDLAAYKVGNGSNSLVFVCAIHGWEDHWDADGIELTKIGNGLIEHFQNTSTNNWSLYIIPAANPDGLSEGSDNNGPGRCTIVGAVDCNRDFPLGFSPGGVSRYHSGDKPLSVPESKDLHDFIQSVKNRTSGEMCVIDLHGWEGAAIGNPEIGQYFRNQFGFEQRYGYGDNRGFMIGWAKSIGAKAALIELPTSCYSHNDVVNERCQEKVIAAVTNLIGGSGSSSSTGGSTSTGSGGSSSSDTTYTANGEVINVQSFLNVRSGAGTNYNSIGQLHQGNKVNVVAKNGKWYKIKYGSGYGYVNFDYIAINNNKEISLDNWQEDCINKGWGPLTKEAYIERINATRLNKVLKDDIDDLVKKNLLKDTFDFSKPSKTDVVAFTNALINDTTVNRFSNKLNGVFYFKENYESSTRKKMSKFKAYKRLGNGQILEVTDLDIPIDKAKLSTRINNAVNDVVKLKFLKGIDKAFVALGFTIAVDTDFSVFLSEGELKSNEEIASTLASVIVTNGAEVIFCSIVGAVATQVVGPQFPVVGAIVGGLAGAFAGYEIGKNLNNIEMEKCLRNLILKILSLLE